VISQHQRYLTLGKYTKNCPKYLIEKAKRIECKKVSKKYIENVLRVIKDEFNSQKHSVTKTNDFKKFVPFDITRKDFKIGKDHIKKDEWIDWNDMEKNYKPSEN
jgi:hypothetical protein